MFITGIFNLRTMQSYAATIFEVSTDIVGDTLYNRFELVRLVGLSLFEYFSDPFLSLTDKLLAWYNRPIGAALSEVSPIASAISLFVALSTVTAPSLFVALVALFCTLYLLVSVDLPYDLILVFGVLSVILKSWSMIFPLICHLILSLGI